MSESKYKNKPGVKYFDLDEVAQEEVVICIFGEDYPLKPVSVDDFIKNTREQADQAQLDENDIAGHMELTKKTLRRAFPDLPEDIFTRMTMRQLQKLVVLAHGMNGQTEAANESSAAAQGNV